MGLPLGKRTKIELYFTFRLSKVSSADTFVLRTVSHTNSSLSEKPEMRQRLSQTFWSCYRMKPISIPIESLTLEQARAKLAACREHNAALAAEISALCADVAKLREEKVALLAELESYRAHIALVRGC
jgi:hypothetical protein